MYIRAISRKQTFLVLHGGAKKLGAGGSTHKQKQGRWALNHYGRAKCNVLAEDERGNAPMPEPTYVRAAELGIILYNYGYLQLT